ncbi:MAG: hypothetical protein ACJ735_08820 [Actinomycetes bacterium]
MSLHTVAGQRIGEDTDDLTSWLRDLQGCPPVTHTHVLTCGNEVHDEPATWFYVEADPGQGVVRRRCLACGVVADTLDSAQRWSHPHMWACVSCGQSIAEAAAGLHAPGDGPEPGPVSWVAIGVRCVGCGVLAGVSDFVLPRASYDEVRTNL